MQLRHFVVGQVEGLDPVPLEAPPAGRASRCRLATSTPTKRCAALRVGVAVVELGDAALAEQRAELAEAARAARGSSPRRSPRAPRPARRARRRSAGGRSSCWRRRRSRPACGRATRCRSHQALTPATASAPGGLEDRARVLEHVLDRRADRVGVDAHHLVDVLRARGGTSPCRPASPRRRRRRGRRAAASTRRPAASERVIASESTGSTPMILIVRPHALDVRGDAGDQAAAADRDEDRVDRPWHWRRISMPMVPCPAMTSGSS